jgi:hypothetical protein
MAAPNGMNLIVRGWIILQSPGLSVRQRDKANALVKRGKRLCEIERAVLRLQMASEFREQLQPLMNRVAVIEFLSYRQQLTPAGIIRSVFAGSSTADRALERTLTATSLGVIDEDGYVVGYSNLRASDVVMAVFDFGRYTFTLKHTDGQLRVNSFTWR